MVEEIALWRFGEKRVLGGGNSVCKALRQQIAGYI